MQQHLHTGIVELIVNAVASVTGGDSVLNHPPVVEKDDVISVMDQLRNLGSYAAMARFEAGLESVCGRRHAVATSSGTAALELALAVVGVGPGDHVAVPAISFVSAANAVRMRHAEPVLVDVRWPDIGMDPEFLENIIRLSEDKPIRAIIAVHVLGHPCRINELVKVAEKHGIPLIEDAAEALGSVVNGRPCGSFGTMSIMSFNNNKIVTTGGGGALLSDDPEIALRALKLATTARVPHPFLIEHDEVAWNHRMGMLPAALGLSQIKRLDELVAAKRALAGEYMRALASTGAIFHVEPVHTRSNYWLPSIEIPREARDAVLTALNKSGFGSRALFTPINQLQPYRREGFPVARDAHERIVCLPGGIALAQRFT